jgi:micrococcal nuclease
MKILIALLCTLPVLMSCGVSGSDCIVTYVYDGDTIKCLCYGTTEKVIRLTGIDAPEKNEKYYDKSRRYLINLVLHKEIKIIEHGNGKYNRILGEIYVANLYPREISILILQAGMAKAYRGRSPWTTHRGDYFRTERTAKKRKKGIWK